MPVPSIYQYLDYREWFRAIFESHRQTNSSYSLRYLAQKLGLDAGNLLKVHQKKRHITKTCVPRLAEEYQLSFKEQEYLLLLIDFAKANTPNKAQLFYEQILRSQNISPTVVGASQYAYYKEWRHTVVLALLHVQPFQGNHLDWSNLLDPKCSVAEIKHSLELLLSLGLAKRKGNKIIPTESMLTTGDAWKDFAIREFQTQMLRLAEHSLHRHSPLNRDISTATITANFNALQKIQELTKTYRKQVLKIAAECDQPDQIFQLNIQLFPVSTKI